MKKEIKALEKKEKELDQEAEQLEKGEYGIKELIHGILIGIVIGFVIAWVLLKR